MFEKTDNTKIDRPERRANQARLIGAWTCGSLGLLSSGLLMADLENKMPYLDGVTAYKAAGAAVGAYLAHKLGLFERLNNQND